MGWGWGGGIMCGGGEVLVHACTCVHAYVCVHALCRCLSGCMYVWPPDCVYV